jgi:alpha-galactosidase
LPALPSPLLASSLLHQGIKFVADYVKSLGGGLLKLGIYSAHDKADCCGGPGMAGFEDQDATFYKANGIEYLKVDSCAGHDLNATVMYQQYANVRDALNRSGNHVYLNICPTTKIEQTFPSLHPPCNAWGDDVYSSLHFQNAGLDVRGLANSALVEYCNNANNWGVVTGLIDAQKALANDAWSAPGSWIDADMLTVGCNDNMIRGTPCDHGTPLTVVEEYSQMSLWCIFASNLMLGSDLRNISSTTLAIIGNEEALAVNRSAPILLCPPSSFLSPSSS